MQDSSNAKVLITGAASGILLSEAFAFPTGSTLLGDGGYSL